MARIPRDIELHLYECLGVKLFRILVFKLEKVIHRKDKGKNINYHVSSFEPRALEGFLKYLFYNGAIHVRNIVFFTGFFLVRYGVFGCISAIDILLWILFIKDCYCVMLQRYNYLRIKSRIDRLREKHQRRIERKAALVSKCNPYTDKNDLQKDLQLVRTMQERFRERECIFIGEEELCTLKRLGQLL